MTVILKMCIYFDLAILFLGVYPKEIIREFFFLNESHIECLHIEQSAKLLIMDHLIQFL